jgi:hypothetical protein
LNKPSEAAGFFGKASIALLFAVAMGILAYSEGCRPAQNVNYPNETASGKIVRDEA